VHQWLIPVILPTREADSGGPWLKGNPGKRKFSRPHLNWEPWCIPVIPPMLEAEIGRFVVPVSSRQK
jgi:hypothetical protein